jgi:hypothetical protein
VVQRGGYRTYLSQVDEDPGGALAQPVAADGAVADTQARRTGPLRVLHTFSGRLNIT